MAAPSDVTIEDLNGTWTLEKSLSSDTEPILTLQGINWVVRKAIHLSEISLKVHQFEEKHETKSRTRVTISQRTSSGLPGTTEDRVLDWSENIQVDHVFGKSVGQARWIRGSRSADGKTYPNIDLQLQTDAEAVKKFLRGEILDDESVATGFLVEEPKNDNSSIESEGEGLWVHLFIQSHNGGWKAEQIWGFEIVNDERRWVRRTAVVNRKGDYKLARMVYRFIDRDNS